MCGLKLSSTGLRFVSQFSLSWQWWLKNWKRLPRQRGRKPNTNAASDKDECCCYWKPRQLDVPCGILYSWRMLVMIQKLININGFNMSMPPCRIYYFTEYYYHERFHRNTSTFVLQVADEACGSVSVNENSKS